MHRAPLVRRIVLTHLVAASAVLAAGCGAASERAVPEPGTGAAAGASAATAPVQRGLDPGGVVVDVAGAVRRPGVYRMPVGSRVHEAIEAAGGARAGADTSALNRAAPLVDGQQVLVGARTAGGDGSGGGGAPAGGAVSINSADASQLDELPGIGPVTAERIVAERESGGPFASVDDLDRVPGIGPSRIEALREAVTT